MNLNEVRTHAECLARYVGYEIRKVILSERDVQIGTKSGFNDFVTEIDRWSEAEITKGIVEKYPQHRIIGEETAEQEFDGNDSKMEAASKKGVVWVVDPIDGTTNFVNRIPQVAVSIGVLVDGIRSIGIAFDPCHDELYSAVKGQGAFRNGKQIKVSTRHDVSNAVIATGVPYDRRDSFKYYQDAYREVFTNSRDLRRFGAAVIDQSWVACGRLDGYFEYGLRAWDVCAASLIVEEAGGQVGNFGTEGKDFNIFTRSFVCGNPKIFGRLQELVSKAQAT